MPEIIRQSARVIVLTLAVVLSFSTKTAKAVSCDELNRLWKDKFHSDFKVAWPVSTFECPSAQSKIAKAIYDVYKPVFTPNQGYSPDFYGWAKPKYTSLSYSDKPFGIAAASMNGGRMVLYDGFFNTDDAFRASSIVHEAAHNIPGDPNHVTCSHGNRKGTTIACDQTFHGAFAGSGYNYDAMYLMWVRDGSSYDELDRTLVSEGFKNLLLNRFNSITKAQIQKWLPASTSAEINMATEGASSSSPTPEPVVSTSNDARRQLEEIRRELAQVQKDLEKLRRDLERSR